MAHVRDIVSAPGSRPYELLLEIGSGGMAKVFLGRAVGAGGFQRYVAVKVCHDHLARDAAFRSMFLDEARLAARIHHPNVVPTLDVGESDDLYLVMEYVEGERLADVATLAAERGAPLPMDIILRVIADGLAGLHAAHGTKDSDGHNLGIVHRDISAHNIIVGTDGITRILDFGIAKAVSQSITTKEGHIKGKLGYMPPEYLHAHEVGRFTDVYAMGVVLWELLAGRRLFVGDTEGQTLMAVMQGVVPSLPALRPDVPAALDAVIKRALHRDPKARFETAAAFAEAIERTGVPVASHRTVGERVTELLGALLDERRRLRRDAERTSSQDTGTTPFTPATTPSVAGALPARAGSPLPWILIAAAVVGLGAWWWLRGPEPTAPAATPAAAGGAPAKVIAAPTAPQPPAVDAGTAAPDAAVPAPAPQRNRVRSAPRHGAKKHKGRSEWLPDDI